MHHKKVAEKPWDITGNEGAYLLLTEKEHDEEATSRSLQEMAQLLVIIRRLQGKLNAKFKRPGQLLVCSYLFCLLFWKVIGYETFSVVLDEHS